MQQIIRTACGVLASAALGACVVVPDRGPPPGYGRVEYRPAPPPAPVRVELRFDERQREMARAYYRGHRDRDHDRDYDRDRDRDRDDDRDRNCPPGLANKHDGCIPPGQAKHWRRGEPLARGVVVQTVPRELEVRIGPAPRGYRYVDVAGDILMIAVATGMVVDAIDDLNRQ
ncbi:MAG: hypothetical protein ACREU5_11225 [Burkholderiales bacterium]